MTSQVPPFPVTTADIAQQMALQTPPRRPQRGTSPYTDSGSPNYLTPSYTPSGSRRGSLNGFDDASRRSSVAKVASDLKKGVKNVTDSTKKATNKVSLRQQLKQEVESTTKKVKDKTADMSTHAMGAAVGASKWVASQTSKRTKAAMDQAKSGLSIGEKFTLFASEKISVLSKRGFTHVFMMLILIVYTALGALLFIACEGPHEEEQKLAITETRLELTKALWKKESKTYQNFTEELKNLLKPYEDQLQLAFSAGVSFDTEDRVWTFWKTMFFCSSITTTIGYGHITPKTTAGRALTIVYALIGIPIFLIIMADFGKLFTRALKHLFVFLRRVYKSGTCTRARTHPTVRKWRESVRIRSSTSHFSSSNVTSVTTITDLDKSEPCHIDESASEEEETPAAEIEHFRRRVNEAKSIHRELSVNELQRIHNNDMKMSVSQSVPQHLLNTRSLDNVQEEPEDFEHSSIIEQIQNEQNKLKEQNEIQIKARQRERRNKSENSINTITGISMKATGGIDQVKDRVLHRKKSVFDPETGEKIGENGTSTPQIESPDENVEPLAEETEVDYFADDNFNLPISLALFILILYMIIGCLIYISFEEWTFFEAFYFIFISMTTIGFGDFVPEHPAYMMTSAIYLIIGLALTAMCINIIQEKLTHTFRDASTKLKESFNRLMEAAAAANTDDIDGPIVIGPPILVSPEEREAENERQMAKYGVNRSPSTSHQDLSV